MSQPEETMSEFEKKLLEAMKAVDAPTRFADRVLAQVQEKPAVQGRLLAMPQRRWWMGGAIAAVLAMGVLFEEQMHLRHERERTEQAQKQFEAAVRITDRTLQHARAQLQRAGIQFGE